MKKEEFINLYNQLGWEQVDNLYNYDCLLTSGFDKDTAYDLIETLGYLWLKDENNYSISKLSDMLYNIYDDIKDDIKNLSTRELLIEMYKGEI